MFGFLLSAQDRLHFYIWLESITLLYSGMLVALRGMLNTFYIPITFTWDYIL